MNRILFILVILVQLTGCSGFLDLVPESNIGTTGSFYKNTKDIEYALTAAYGDLQSGGLYGTNLVLMTDVRSDDLGSFANSGGNAGREFSIKMFTASSDNQIFRDTWANHYQLIYKCNNVIKHIDVVKDEKLRKQYMAEASFLRALSYFNIVRLWGNAPLLLTPLTTSEAAKCVRNKKEDVYNAIEADLIFASNPDNLPKYFGKGELGRATSLAAKALLAKVYITQSKWNLAKIVLDELINIDNNNYHYLMSDITNVFSTAPAPGSTDSDFKNYTGWQPQTMNREILFAVLYNKDLPSEGRGALTYYANQADINEKFKYSSSSCIYDKTDRRADLMRSMKGTNNDNALLVKYADIQSSIKQFGYHTPVLRWSDVLLMQAEVLNEISFDGSESSLALDALNKVRSRSFSSGAYQSTDLTDQSKFRNAVYLERRLEFPMEMQRWFDLIRTNNAIEAISEINIQISTKDLLYPIPNSEVVLRNDPINFPQNPGYN